MGIMVFWTDVLEIMRVYRGERLEKTRAGGFRLPQTSVGMAAWFGTAVLL